MFLFFLTIIEDQDDREYIAHLYKKYYPLLKKQAHSIIWDYGMIDDLIQDAFLKLIPKIPLVRTLNDYQRTSYIVYTMRHVCLDYIRKKSRRSKHTFLGATEDIAPVLTATGNEFAHIEIHEVLEQALFQLTERDRNLLCFKYYMEMTDKEIAHLSGIPADHVRQYVARARRRAIRFLSKGEG
ncbi:RNA polymerase sigma factor [Paenibacillus glucanolyticus]|uniref:RNA polymerase sigma factor n=1 Tax=Paenibacillus glucanolyticus TaxID=59843 RepID=UPI00128B2B75|nr:sigma-70 family RNA polymerase sigma factor [Paenibacillus glucanolyticus]MPY19909.1 sigma-70 family RNA polymerase sigma factor [Paenibacillus glucanolyticus]